MQRVLITGANRGLGLEFTRQFLERGECVFACCRNPEAAVRLGELKSVYRKQLEIVEMDVSDFESIRRSHEVVKTHTDVIDILINNAGVYSIYGSKEPSEHLGTLRFEDALKVFRINAVAPIIVVQEYLDLLVASSGAKIVGISTGYASLSLNTKGFPYYYSASKAAMNMFMRSLSVEVKKWGITAVLLDPGWVQTDMGGPGAPLTPKQSVEGMIRVIDAIKPEQSGCFLNWRGETVPW